ncbi:selenocysteine-specific translation elongation factor [Oribacterium sp. oral taxon 108]|uniref:selenocysteine-specific translation elongation factor n=1 Tax=Oribacterium sp. oral taxon 108 TaxID=712414 RepID=UPI00020DD732|nr:selenocysteine-specific translation elongation factor [Oribacterium sp. oral taxon 108]EGL37707.1 selenocysteine-specific translation elongation factor [Oribacterium sp. oral taxon 108 str. F0425]
MEERHYVIGTAGHIDHGKTALVKALCGCDTDRLKEEKERGMSIALGFASLLLPSGKKISIIDTPGHEKFIRSMVSGAMGMDLVLLVVSAKEGVMPQTEEHLAILRLLQIKKVVLVLTMVDLVDSSLLLKREEEVRELYKTFFRHEPEPKIFSISSYTGEGISALKTYLSEEAEKIVGKSSKGVFRMPVDRVFSVAGAGTIVTGTALSGKIQKDKHSGKSGVSEEIREAGDSGESGGAAGVYLLYPEEREVKVRNIQVHGEDVNSAFAGERIALNLQGMEKAACKKGDIIAEKGSLQPSFLLDCRIECISPFFEIKHNQHLELMIGTAHIPCKVIFLEGERIKKGESSFVQLQLQEKTVSVFRERFILRNDAEGETLGGGFVLDPCPSGRHRRGRFPLTFLEALENEGEEALLASFLKKRKRNFSSFTELKKRFSGFPKIQEIVEKEKISHLVSSDVDNNTNSVFFTEENGNTFLFTIELNGELFAILSEEEMLMRKELEDYLRDFHKKNPYKLGEKSVVLHSKLFSSYNKNTYKALLKAWEEKGDFRFGEGFIALSDYKPVKDALYTKIANALVNDMQKGKYSFMKLSDHFWLSEEKNRLSDVVASLENKGTLVKLDGEYYTLRKLFENLKNFSLDKMEKEGEITIDALREEFGISRKNAKLFFKATDRMGITKDRGFESARSVP